MDAAEHKRADDYLYLVDESAERASTRNRAIPSASIKSGVSANALRLAYWRKGKETPHRSLKFAFSEEEENLLEAVCVIHAHQGTPLSDHDFIELASI